RGEKVLHLECRFGAKLLCPRHDALCAAEAELAERAQTDIDLHRTDDGSHDGRAGCDTHLNWSPTGISYSLRSCEYLVSSPWRQLAAKTGRAPTGEKRDSSVPVIRPSQARINNR